MENIPSRAPGGWHRAGPVEAIGLGVARTVQMADTTFYYLGRAIRGQMSFDQLGGPLRTAQLSHAIATAGVQAGDTLAERAFGLGYNLVNIIAMISVGVGIFNLLPIPVLDGGHLAFYAYEAVARRPLNAAVQAASYRVGLALLLGLMLFATTNDLRHSSVFHFLGGPFS
jgi:regulator of sigma E protease